METYRSMEGWEVVEKSISPEAYRPLPAGSKLTWYQAATCGVDVDTTACVIDSAGGRHGFVLDPKGSWTF